MSRYTIVIMHGTYGSPEGNWFGWLARELEQYGHTAIAPKFPTPREQTIQNWIEVLDNEVATYDDYLVLVGHSSACMVICAKLEQLASPIRAAFLVSPFLGAIGNTEYDAANDAFNHYPYDWAAIKGKASFYTYRGDNDPYVPLDCATTIPRYLGIKETIIPRGGHLNSESGYMQFPLLLEAIIKEIEGI
jgi:hypothetical protein